MVFHYTGAKIFNVPQGNPDLSLGGFVSSTIIPNDKINNIFGDISAHAKQNLTTETKAIILRNTTGQQVTNVLLGFIYPTVPIIFKLEVGVVTLDPTDQFIEQINSTGDSPYNCTFYEPFITVDANNNVLVNNSLNLGTIAINKSLGIWVRRTILQQNALSIDDENTFLKTLAANPSVKNINQVKFVLKYDTP